VTAFFDPLISTSPRSGPTGSISHAVAFTAVIVTGVPGAEVGEGKVGVITPARLVDTLAAVLPAGAAGGDLLDAPVALLGIPQAKGLEFDSVVVVEPAAIVAEGADGRDRRAGLRALYMALTRTTRRLHLVHAEPLPPELLSQ
jgi:hypothetical protein